MEYKGGNPGVVARSLRVLLLYFGFVIYLYLGQLCNIFCLNKKNNVA